MHRLMLVAALIILCVLAWAEPALQIGISKRIPAQGDTVRLSAYLEGWQAPGGASGVVFTAQRGGIERTLGKCALAANPAKPFEPSVEWAPGASGLYRITARLESTGEEARLLAPVVTQNVYFCFYGATRPETIWMTHHLTAGASEIDGLHARGVVALKHVGGVSYLGGPRPEDIRKDIDFEQLAQKVVADYTQVDPWDGIAIDELGMWDDHPEQEQLALGFWQIMKKARAAAPDKFIAAWQFASLSPLVCNMLRDTTDLVMCEVYQNYFRAWYDQHRFYDYLQQRIDMARDMMISKKTVIGLSISSDYGSITPEELEDQIRYIRAHGPEIRGLAFFTTSRCDPEVLKRANDCCYRYWVKPAVGLFSEADLTFSDYQPRKHGVVRINATVHNVGGSTAAPVAVRFWEGDPANGGTLIGQRSITSIPAARWVDPLARDAASIEPPEAMRKEGFGMVTVSVDWKATRSGPVEIWAEIVPDDGYTIIRGFQSKRISVK